MNQSLVGQRIPRPLLLAARASRELNRFAEADALLERYRVSTGTTEDLILEQVLLRAQMVKWMQLNHSAWID